MELEDFVVEFADQFDETDPSEIDAETAFHDLDEWSSLIALSVMNMVEKKLGKQLNFKEMKAMVTVRQLFEYIQSK
ncbi:MAG: acyl carrier protein [Bacteroidales bacterium]|nr:acyl carrier protein [Bacteroidales bacterium]